MSTYIPLQILFLLCGGKQTFINYHKVTTGNIKITWYITKWIIIKYTVLRFRKVPLPLHVTFHVIIISICCMLACASIKLLIIITKLIHN